MVAADRTNDFHSLVLKHRKNNAISPLPKQNQKSHFSLTAQQISKEICATHEKLEKLAKLASSTSLFDDPVLDIQELIYIVKKDIANLNKKLESAKSLSKLEKNKQTLEHTDKVVMNLSNKLAHTTREFKNVLSTRAENYQKQQEFRKQFVGQSYSIEREKQKSMSTLYKPELEENNNNANGTNHSDSNHQTSIMVDRKRFSHQSRLDAVQSIEETMVELNGIMQEISVMVSTQGEDLVRIDHNINETQKHVEKAQKELLTFLEGISSNRGLILKMLLILVVFIGIFFVFFV